MTHNLAARAGISITRAFDQPTYSSHGQARGADGGRREDREHEGSLLCWRANESGGVIEEAVTVNTNTAVY